MMRLTNAEIAGMIDLSAVRANDGENTIRELIACAQQYKCHLVTTLPGMTLLAKELLINSPEIGVAGNVGFPSGGQTTTIKVAEAKELIKMGCNELDMVLSIGKLISGKYREVLNDICAVVEAGNGVPIKVIMECHYLSPDEILKACDLCIEAGADYVKTGTGWAPTGATLENITLIKSYVGNAIGIKASGGIRELATLIKMYRLGANRFGIGLRSAINILTQSKSLPNGCVDF